MKSIVLLVLVAGAALVSPLSAHAQMRPAPFAETSLLVDSDFAAGGEHGLTQTAGTSAAFSEFWGKGYAAEAAEQCLEHAFTDLDRQHVSSFIDPQNLRSIRVAEKIGERLEGNVLLLDLPDRSILQFGISRDDWQNRARTR